ncbi:MAG TPA: DNA gyrase C-terminal beta-propeller domain-containing protein, partial [Caulobacteraceae bacterium]|nr:DNA gyrase C-terminal beta-propeller domain-containing protein [Caulobacteraceae bacterium]
FASDGRFFTLACDKLPSARGAGEPLRLMLDLDDRVEIIDVFAHKPGGRRVLASKAGYGFIMPEEEALAFRRAGKQVLNGQAAVSLAVDGDQIAVIGDNGKIVVFPLSELPEMPRGKGVKLQSYREGGLRDAIVFKSEEGASWTDAAGRTRAWPEWRNWETRRAAAGKLAPRGFPSSKRFRPK